jgi:hypothetical protein
MPPTLQSNPILLEVLAHVPTDFFHCWHCEQVFDLANLGGPVHQETRSAYPPAMLQDAEQLTAWLNDLSEQYGEQLHVRVIDPQSIEGFFKSLRHWARRYPTFIIDHRIKYTGWEPNVLERLLADRISGDNGI